MGPINSRHIMESLQQHTYGMTSLATVPVLWTIFLTCGVSGLPEYHWPD